MAPDSSPTSANLSRAVIGTRRRARSSRTSSPGGIPGGMGERGHRALPQPPIVSMADGGIGLQPVRCRAWKLMAISSPQALARAHSPSTNGPGVPVT